jgi:hypothetical protein
MIFSSLEMTFVIIDIVNPHAKYKNNKFLVISETVAYV